MKPASRALVFIFLVCASTQLFAQSDHDPTAVLARARSVMGFDRAKQRVLHFRAATATEENYQSERTYPPFFSSMSSQEIWFDPATGVLRIDSDVIFPGGGPSPNVATIDDGKNAESVLGQQHVPLSRRQVTARALDAWAVIADWTRGDAVRVAGTERYRDYDRLVLARRTPQGDERLFIDAKSGFPVKLDYTEPHYLWGQRHIEYVWSTWVESSGILVPGSAFRVADGDVEMSQTVGTVELVNQSSDGLLTPPATPDKVPDDLPPFLQPISPTVIKISDTLALLTNPGYTEAVALAGNEIYVFDATQGEQRARLDADAIMKLFPGRHKINVVVTDLAWPHIAGVRYWISQDATIVAHPAARDFLERVVDRRWTLAPDSLEQRRAAGKTVHMNFVPAGNTLTLANNQVRVAPIDGIASELALMVYLPVEKFLWASDYIQTLDGPSLYASEVMRAVERSNFRPAQVAAEHLPLTTWSTVIAAQSRSGPEAAQ